MAEINDEFDEKARATADEHRKMEFEDLQRELMGIEGPREARFLDADLRDSRDINKRGEKDAQRMSRLQLLLLQDPAYAALYNETFDKLRDAERAAEIALASAILTRDAAERSLQEMLDRAPRLPDGTRVFRDAQGQVWTQDGQLVDAAVADGIEWRGNEFSYEQYLAQKDTLQSAQDHIQALTHYQINVLGRVRDRMSHEKNPASKDDMESFQRDMDGLFPAATYAHTFDKSAVEPEVIHDPSSISMPKL